MGLIVLVVLILLLLGAAPWHPYSRPYGWYPASGVGLLFVLLIVLLLFGVIPWGFGPRYYP